MRITRKIAAAFTTATVLGITLAAGPATTAAADPDPCQQETSLLSTAYDNLDAAHVRINRQEDKVAALRAEARRLRATVRGLRTGEPVVLIEGDR